MDRESYRDLEVDLGLHKSRESARVLENRIPIPAYILSYVCHEVQSRSSATSPG